MARNECFRVSSCDTLQAAETCGQVVMCSVTPGTTPSGHWGSLKVFSPKCCSFNYSLQNEEEQHLGWGQVPQHWVVCWLELGRNYVYLGKLAASVSLVPIPCALQKTQRNHDYEAWRVAGGRSYKNGCIGLEAVEVWDAQTMSNCVQVSLLLNTILVSKSY